MKLNYNLIYHKCLLYSAEDFNHILKKM